MRWLAVDVPRTSQLVILNSWIALDIMEHIHNTLGHALQIFCWASSIVVNFHGSIANLLNSISLACMHTTCHAWAHAGGFRTPCLRDLEMHPLIVFQKLHKEALGIMQKCGRHWPVPCEVLCPCMQW